MNTLAHFKCKRMPDSLLYHFEKFEGGYLAKSTAHCNVRAEGLFWT